MSKPKVFRSADNPKSFGLSVHDTVENRVQVIAVGFDDSHPAGMAITVDLSPADIPALCRELQRVAKLAKEGGGNG